MLNLFLAVAGIALCFPLGVLLALGRRSKLPLIRAVSVGYIELFRGVPLYVLLLMSAIALGFFLPTWVDNPPGLVVRAIVVFTLFTAAYVAEIVRGGLQSLPRGQTEAAQALGLSPVQDDVPHRAAAGAAQRDPGPRRAVHQPVQGHDAGRRGDRPPRRARGRPSRSRRSPSSAARA